jgi:hypothetical protein
MKNKIMAAPDFMPVKKKRVHLAVPLVSSRCHAMV